MVNFIRQIPSQMDHAFMQVIVKGAEAKQKITQSITGQKWWQEDIRPLYRRHIEPLRETEYLVLGSSLSIAAIIMTLAIEKILPTAFFPLALGASTLILTSACAFARYRVNKHFQEVAWESLDAIRRIVHKMTLKNPQFDRISLYQALLKQPEFDHIRNDLKELDKQIRDFKKDISENSSLDDKTKADRKKTLMEYLKGLQQKLAPYKEIQDLLDLP